MAKVIRVDGIIYDLHSPTLEDLQRAVGGYIEILSLGDKMYLVVNEEGKLQNLHTNEAATMIYGHDIIVGPAVLCTFKELNQ